LRNAEKNNYSEVNYVDDEDMPEIVDIPIKKWKQDKQIYYIYDDLDTNNTSFNCENESSLSCKEKLQEKLIDNAIETEKTMMKFFDNFNPILIPNKE